MILMGIMLIMVDMKTFIILNDFFFTKLSIYRLQVNK